jgi:hypothetical protein
MYLEEGHKPKILLIVLGAILGSLVTAVYYHGKIAKIQNQASFIQSQASNETGPGNIPTSPVMPKIPIPNEVTSISGTVEKIEGKTLTVKTFFFGEQKTYTMTVGDNTKIQKSEIKKELPTPEEGKPFEPFTLTDAKLSDIRQNDKVVIEANENIKNKASFEAKTVSIQVGNIPAPETPKTENVPISTAAPTIPSP